MLTKMAKIGLEVKKQLIIIWLVEKGWYNL